MSERHKDDQQKVPDRRNGVEKLGGADVSGRFNGDRNSGQYDSAKECEYVPDVTHWLVCRLWHLCLLKISNSPKIPAGTLHRRVLSGNSFVAESTTSQGLRVSDFTL